MKSTLLGMLQENIATQAVVKAFLPAAQDARLVHDPQRGGAPEDRLRPRSCRPWSNAR